jgi:hypothetical protein
MGLVEGFSVYRQVFQRVATASEESTEADFALSRNLGSGRELRQAQLTRMHCAATRGAHAYAPPLQAATTSCGMIDRVS